MDKIFRKKGKGGIDAWRYVKHICRPILWPTCLQIMEDNPNFVLMEDGAPAHIVAFTNREREKLGIKKACWPSHSPDLNCIEHIWDWMEKVIAAREEKVTTVEGMKSALVETWDSLTVERINQEVEKLPHILSKCIAVEGSNNVHA